MSNKEYKSLLESTNNTRWCISNKYLRSDLIKTLTEHDIKTLKDLNIRTVIDLRTLREVVQNKPAEWLKTQEDIIYINHPLYLPTKTSDGTLEAKIEFYGETVDGNFHALIDFIRRRARIGTVLFFCHQGKDRTGIVSAILQYLEGYSFSNIEKEYMLSSEYLNTEPDDPHRCKLEYIKATMGAYFNNHTYKEVDGNDIPYIKSLIINICNKTGFTPRCVMGKVDFIYLMTTSFNYSVNDIITTWKLNSEQQNSVSNVGSEKTFEDEINEELLKYDIKVSDW